MEGRSSLLPQDSVLDTKRPFTESGKCDDEVTFEFDDQKKLFVSRNFLRYASPVFEAMFNHDFKEKNLNCVELTGKKYEEFLEFLLSIHPGILKSVTESNVLSIVGIAEEYQVKSMTTKCKEVMKAWLLKTVEEAKSMDYNHRVEPLRECFRIINTAISLNYDDIVTSGVKTVAKYGHVHYIRNRPRPTRTHGPVFGARTIQQTSKTEEPIDQIKKECMEMFNGLPAEVRCRILSERLLFWNDSDMK
ncbi:uncharacterized protein LOC123558974 [Mercenaria mercenaria]|uniref:uncharacterized protein LOC123558974 n=1 Tax=Mercenaria mercenaria TaxID=6596 RepID=UPI001E1E21ED|nr:uncharacterized protein LOC123558974 [Mercenaria mercenaria]